MLRLCFRRFISVYFPLFSPIQPTLSVYLFVLLFVCLLFYFVRLFVEKLTELLEARRRVLAVWEVEKGLDRRAQRKSRRQVTCLSIYLYLYLCLYLCLYLSISVSLAAIYPSIYPSIYLSIYLSISHNLAPQHRCRQRASAQGTYPSCTSVAGDENALGVGRVLPLRRSMELRGRNFRKRGGGYDGCRLGALSIASLA